MRQPFVAGNWKLNGSKASCQSLIQGILEGMSQVKNAEVAVCPPFLYLPQAAELLNGSSVALGAQNACDQEQGAFTGEVSSSMLKEFGCRYVILGHSERRSIYGESDALVASKTLAVVKQGLIPILCVGELLEEREAGKTESVVARQLDAVIEAGGVELLAATVIAYEPVWAIGTGKTASPEQAQAVHAFIRSKIAGLNAAVAEKIRILYGGSVKPDNAAELFSQADIDGGLIGGAALDAPGFIAICAAANGIDN